MRYDLIGFDPMRFDTIRYVMIGLDRIKEGHASPPLIPYQYVSTRINLYLKKSVKSVKLYSP